MKLDPQVNTKIIDNFSCSHGNIVTIATNYFASLSSQTNLFAATDNKVIKDFPCCHGNIVMIATNYICCCHGNIVTIATNYFAGLFSPIESSSTSKQESYEIFLLLHW